MLEKFVCDGCLDDPDLKDFARRNAQSAACSYCGRAEEGPIAARVYDVGRHMRSSIERECDDPNEGMGWDSAEGGWQGTVFTTYEVLMHEIGGLPCSSQQLSDDLLHAVGNDRQWCRPFRTTRWEQLRFGWDEFCHQVRHRTRYLFFTESERPSEGVEPEGMLDEIGTLITEYGILANLPAGAVFFRARAHAAGEGPYNSPDQLCSPPRREHKLLPYERSRDLGLLRCDG